VINSHLIIKFKVFMKRSTSNSILEIEIGAIIF
jgi:hypothetical protein